LHDGTQQELTGLSLFAGALCEVLNDAKPSDIQGSVVWTLAENDYRRIIQTAEKLTQGLQEANQHVNALSHGIMPVQIDAEGLRSALAELAAATDEQQQIHCRFEFDGSSAIASNLVATQLYRIAQESLNNALKHGRADDILISLSQQAEQIVLEICDNGVGFDPTRTLRSPIAAGGVGLRIMKYRASMLGGVLEVDLNHGHGTTVRCTIPVTGDFL
jgi:signal transduction histidine kinase